jgi:predicted ATP-binding protein involved in virulence
MRVESLWIEDLPPFRKGTVTFPISESRANLAEVHLFTGQNGTGKSRILSLLAASTIEHDISNLPTLERFPEKLTATWNRSETQSEVRFLSGDRPRCSIIRSNVMFFSAAFNGAVQLSKTNFQPLQRVVSMDESERLTFRSITDPSASQRIANLKIQAMMETMATNDGTSANRYQTIINRLETSISEVTGRPFNLIVRSHPVPTILFKWGSHSLEIEELPSGLNAILSWMFSAATLMDMHYPDSKDPLTENAVFFLDEPETYLHPEWQRHVIPMAQNLFPNSQLFVATHSPFVVSSLNEGFIYKFMPHEDGTVTISDAIPASKGDSYVNAVSEILGLSEWFDPESESLLAEFRTQRDSALKGDATSQIKARDLATSIAKRSDELANIMGMELRQLDRNLNPPASRQP